MFDLFFVAMWGVPLLMVGWILHRFAKHVRMIQQHIKNPDALAEALRAAAAAAEHGEDFDPKSVVIEVLTGEHEASRFAADARTISPRPDPIGESGSSGFGAWFAAALVIGVVAAVLHVQ